MAKFLKVVYEEECEEVVIKVNSEVTSEQVAYLVKYFYDCDMLADEYDSLEEYLEECLEEFEVIEWEEVIVN